MLDAGEVARDTFASALRLQPILVDRGHRRDIAAETVGGDRSAAQKVRKHLVAVRK